MGTPAAEFMAGEPEEPRRTRRDEAPTLSLFEWALEREQSAPAVVGDVLVIAMAGELVTDGAVTHGHDPLLPHNNRGFQMT